MKRIVSLISICFISASLFAEGERSTHGHYIRMNDEIESILSDYGEVAIGGLTLNDLEAIKERLAVPMQKASYIRKSMHASFMSPGLGQFKNGAAGAGLLFMIGNLGVMAGTVAGSYFLLPPELTALDYLDDSFTEIEAAWQGQSLRDLGPALAVMSGGMVLDIIIRTISAKHAAKTARGKIDSGEVDFTPRHMRH